MILIRYLIFDIVLIKVNASEKDVKEKQGNLKMVMRRNSPPNNSAFPLVICEQFCSTDYPNFNAQSFLMLVTISVLISPKSFVVLNLQLTRKGLKEAFMVE